MESFLKERLGHVPAQCGRYLRVAGRVLHHVRHPLLPGVGDGVDTPGAGALHLGGLLPEGLHQVGHVCRVLLVDLGQLVVEVTYWKGNDTVSEYIAVSQSYLV